MQGEALEIRFAKLQFQNGALVALVSLEYY